MHAPFSPSNPIRVLIADDSSFMRAALSRMIESDPTLKVIATATDGVDALEKAARLDPDVMTLDVEMPRLNGLEVLRRIMTEHPRPVIMVSTLTKAGAQATIEAFELGAFDCLAKNITRGTTLSILQIRDELTEKLKVAAAHRHRVAKPFVPAPRPAPVPLAMPRPLRGRRPSVIAIGTSTGGPRALQTIIPALPAHLPVGILIVQHMPPGFTGPFAQRLNSLSQLTVREAQDHDRVEPGVALIAPAGWHMTVQRITPSHCTVAISKEPPQTLHRPSVDVLMQSVADVYGSSAAGIVLTGMGSDGLQGLSAIYQKGGYTAAQDEASSTVYGMPRACVEARIARQIVSLDQMAGEIIRLAQAEPAGFPAAHA